MTVEKLERESYRPFREKFLASPMWGRQVTSLCRKDPPHTTEVKVFREGKKIRIRSNLGEGKNELHQKTKKQASYVVKGGRACNSNLWRGRQGGGEQSQNFPIGGTQNNHYWGCGGPPERVEGRFGSQQWHLQDDFPFKRLNGVRGKTLS